MRTFFTLLLLIAGSVVYGQSGEKIDNKPIDKDSLILLESKVISNPEDLAAHTRLIKYIGIDNPLLQVTYEKLSQKFPDCQFVPFALGEAYANVESPKAKPWLLMAAKIDPTMAKAWYHLWIDGERWGDFTASREYLKKAMEADPANPDYAFYFRSSFKNVDAVKYRQGMEEMPLLFPTNERGAQALYWLGIFVKSNSEKLKVYKQLKDTYDPAKFRWSSSGMYDYFYTLLDTIPSQALELAQEIQKTAGERDSQSWISRIKLAQDFIQIQNLIGAGKTAEALEVVKNVAFERRSPATNQLMIIRSELEDAIGNTAGGYSLLIKQYASNPSDKIGNAIAKLGAKLGKNKDQIFKEIWGIRDSAAVQATNFSLGKYDIDGKASLSDYKGKVVLLTYWFPGCGPCRGEFPHFENVIRKFSKDQVVYLGINMVREQDDYVLPFMKSSGYSFYPLKGEEDQGNLVARGAPTNYLIDQQGRIIFRNFRTDGNNERELELMIGETLMKGMSSFEVKGNITGVDFQKIYVSFFGEKDAAIGNAEIVKGGEFIFSGKVKTPVVARLSFSRAEKLMKSPDGRGYYPLKSANLWVIIYPGAELKIEGDLTDKDFMDIYPAGNPENNYFSELNSKVMPLINENGNIMLKLARNKEMPENEKAPLVNRQKEIQKELTDIKLNFLSARPNTVAALWLMEDMLVRSELDTREMAKYLSKVDPSLFSGNYFYEAVKNRVKAVDNVVIGKLCPEISTNASTDGSLVSLSDLRGKYVIIDFWGTWCGPCMAGVPHMKAFRDKYADRLQIFGVSNDKNVSGWKSVIEKNGMNWPNVLIGPGEKDFVAKFNVQG
ncbi:MAG: redoxin domain-containing protein, partial [Bacteroidales bacterium]|nr:redoxin domain-containing protein [Bacteroidales bacterium]